MPKTRPPYRAEFCQRIVELAAAGRTPAELAHQLGCSAQTITNWLATAEPARPSGCTAPAALMAAEREELQRLRKENRQLPVEREILGKATAWFAARSDKTFTPFSSS